MGILSTVPQSWRIRSCRCLTDFSQDASASLMYSSNDDLPEGVFIPCTFVVTHSLEAEPIWVEWKTATRNMTAAASQSMCITRLGLLKTVLMTAMVHSDPDRKSYALQEERKDTGMGNTNMARREEERGGGATLKKDGMAYWHRPSPPCG